MFFTYLRRELRRRMRQASLIAVGLALGIGLVITVTALSAGVKNAQGEVLHSLYGVGTDITVTKAPAAGSAARRRSGSAARSAPAPRPAPGTSHRRRHPGQPRPGHHRPPPRSPRWHLRKGVAAAAGDLDLTDTKITGKIPAFNSGGRRRRLRRRRRRRGRGRQLQRLVHAERRSPSAGSTWARASLGPLSSGKLTAGRTFTSADARRQRRRAGLGLRHAEQAGGRLDHHHRQDQLQGRRDRQRARRVGLLRRLHPAGPRPGPGRA